MNLLRTGSIPQQIDALYFLRRILSDASDNSEIPASCRPDRLISFGLLDICTYILCVQKDIFLQYETTYLLIQISLS